MKVGIIGAGISGLSCAFQLKKYGITPTVFEKRSQIGEVLGRGFMILPNVSLPNNPFLYLEEKYGLNLKPLNKIKNILICSPKNVVHSRGNLGYFIARGPQAHSLENQIFSQLDININFDNFIHFEHIKNSFDKIVIATGTNIIAKELNVWTDYIECQARIANCIGNFKTDTAIIWFNTEYAKNTYAYFIPLSKTCANIGLLVNNTTCNEINYYWKKFLSKEKIKLNITETVDAILHTGIVYPHCLNEKIYFTGNTGGFTSSFLGLGAFNAIESGILAGESIAKGLDYDKSVHHISEYIEKNYELRKMINGFSNKNYEYIVKLLNFPGIKHFVYKNPYFKITNLAPLAKTYNKFKNS